MALTKVNQSVLGVLERPALAWMAARLPKWTIPDHMTFVGVIGALLSAAGFLLSNWGLTWLWLASAGLILNWLGDSLDGTLARHRCIERPRYGFFVDHTSDVFSQSAIFLALGASPCAHFGFACVGLIAYLIMFVYTLIGAHVRNTMRITYLGFGLTEIRALLLLGNLAILVFGVIRVPAVPAALTAEGWVSGHDVVILALSITTAVVIVPGAMREARTLANLDPTPKVSSNSQ